MPQEQVGRLQGLTWSLLSPRAPDSSLVTPLSLCASHMQILPLLLP